MATLICDKVPLGAGNNILFQNFEKFEMPGIYAYVWVPTMGSGGPMLPVPAIVQPGVAESHSLSPWLLHEEKCSLKPETIAKWPT